MQKNNVLYYEIPNYQKTILLQDLWMSIWIKIKGKNIHFLLVCVSINNSLRFNAQSQNCICRLVNLLGTKGHISDLTFDNEIIIVGVRTFIFSRILFIAMMAFPVETEKRKRSVIFLALAELFCNTKIETLVTTYLSVQTYQPT